MYGVICNGLRFSRIYAERLVALRIKNLKSLRDTLKGGPESMKKIRAKRDLKESLQIYGMLAPNLFLFLLLSVYPIIWTFRFMFYSYGGLGTGAPVFIGFENFKRLFTNDPVFWRSVTNTFIYAAGKIGLVIPLAFFSALMLNQKTLKGAGFLRATLFLPTIMSSAVMALVFYLMFNVYNGEVNKYIMKLGLSELPINWLGQDYAMLTVIIIGIWGGLGNYMIYFLAGLQGISEETYESANLDGVNWWQRIWYITLPMLGPILKMILMLSIVIAFQDMSTVMVLTEGGPVNATMIMFLYAYQFFFPIAPGSMIVTQFGYGAAVSVVAAGIVGIVTVIYLVLARKLDDLY
ncbi:MAG: sugar ABC transporter permease [Ruminococcaceae bacterium]|nr:sugar ABC transporter permease [Oscillospiraceae bacterium]